MARLHSTAFPPFQLARRILADAVHEAYLMIDEDEHRVLGGDRPVGRFDWSWHSRSIANVCLQANRLSALENSTWDILWRAFHELACCYSRRAFGGFFDQSRDRLRLR